LITFVAFHVDIRRTTMRRIRERIKSVRVTSPRRCLPAVFGSAERFHPGCGKIVLTDRSTRMRLPPGIEVRRLDLDASEPLLARNLAWTEFLADVRGHVVFLDSDILVNGDLGPVFADPFDVGLTYRNASDWPINVGINFVHGDRLDRGRAFHDAWLGRFREAYRGSGVWGGDQDAIRDFVTGADFTREDVHLHREGGWDILMLPCATYNFSSRDNKRMPDFYPDRKVLHFKGRRKRDMLPYWKRHLRSGGGSSA